MTETPVNPLTLWRLSACASMAGLTPDVLESAIREGDQIPGTSIVELGPRGLKHVRRADIFYAWLKGETLPAAESADLFE